MKTVSSKFKLQTLLIQSQLPLELPHYIQQEEIQIQRMFNGLGYFGLAASEKFKRED